MITILIGFLIYVEQHFMPDNRIDNYVNIYLPVSDVLEIKFFEKPFFFWIKVSPYLLVYFSNSVGILAQVNFDKTF